MTNSAGISLALLTFDSSPSPVNFRTSQLFFHEESFQAEGFSSLYIDGGKVTQSFLQEDCINEMIITKAPVLIGSGIPLFGALDFDLRFEHLSTKAFSNGLVKSHYKRKREQIFT